MEVMARVKATRVSPKNLRVVANSVKGMRVDDAITVLRFTTTPLAKIVMKVVQSAAANAENNFQMNRDGLRIVKIYADQGPTLKRFRAKPRGRVAPILKRSSHLTVIVDEDEEA
ncbi:MAG: 50S ribosomal protein L22 [Chloroflexi bacterium]|nr:50S ribosomal protein L22 [Chloroflexota bacterium]